MRVLIDAANCTVGGGAAARHLLRALDNIQTGIEIIVVVPAGETFELRPRRLRLVRLRAGTSSHWWRRERARTQAAAEIPSVDVYHALTCETPPVGLRAGVIITSFTNNNPYTVQRNGWCFKDRLRFAALRRRIRTSLARATHVVVHTGAAKALLEEVVPDCARPVLVHRLGAEPLPGFQYDPRQWPGSCILCPSSYLPHKNLERLMRAYDLCCRSVEAPPLIVAGFAPEPYYSRLDRIRRSLDSAASIQLLREQSDGTMVDLYRRALAVAVPSFQETFSLPVVEALASRIPVLCSDPGDTHWLPYREFQPGLLYWDPFSTASIADALGRIIRSEEERCRLSALLRSNLTPRSWNDYAHELLECYLELIPQPQLV